MYKAYSNVEKKEKAIKLIETTSTKKDMMRRVYNELYNLSKITQKYDYVIQCEAFYMDETHHKVDKSRIDYGFYMIFEYFHHGTLRNLLFKNKKNKSPMSEHEVGYLMS